MPIHVLWLFVLVAIGLLSPAVGSAAVAILDDRSDVDRSETYDITQHAYGTRFYVTSTMRLSAIDVWLADGVANDNGILDNFSGDLRWTIDDSIDGTPASITVTGRAVAISATDTGFQTETGAGVVNADIVKIRLELDQPIALLPAEYRLTLHEGAFGSDDGSAVWWVQSQRFGPQSTGAFAYVLLGSTTTWNQGGIVDLTSGSTIGDFVEAADFLVLSGTARFSAVDVWLLDDVENDNGVLDSFGGTLGWAIYANSTGKPGTLLASGRDTAPALADTGLQSAGDTDAVRARIRLGRTFSLPVGTYWFALHEGNWGSAYDGSELTWAFATANFANSSWGDSNEVSPSSWSAGPDADPAFVVFEDPIFASGFEAYVTCAWPDSTNPVCP